MDCSIIKSVNAFSKVMRERAPKDFTFGLFSLFPVSCCEFSSLLLSRFLHEEHHGIDINIITGQLRKNIEIRHIWLKIENTNVDITANQFDEALPEVLITFDGGWHDQYKVISNQKFNNDFDTDFWHEDKRAIQDDYKFLSRRARASFPNNALKSLTPFAGTGEAGPLA